ncbi:hypothetical protein [Tabrizicola sp.]|uniref:hypothetical protein n=1 Tax=Tabrizicola sp. TaxID=2005166 RepID=UPI0027358289|nr:hypothetical protein [Tabrizicola sp.]MDP3198025.1 hypothetical protein [Tabrizicola sp.]
MTEAASRSDLPRKRLAARAIRPPAEARQKEREQEIDQERRRQRELDRDLGWEL